MKKFVFWMMVMIAGAFFSSRALAATELVDPIYQGFDTTFDYSLCCGEGGDSLASVHSWVTYDDVDTFTYYYQIQGVSAGYEINYFQLGLPDIPTSELSYLGETSSSFYGQPGNYPAVWRTYLHLDTQDEIAYGVGAIYSIPITEGLTSYILYFDSSLQPIKTSGLLSGFGPDDNNICLCGSVYTPIPEPITLALLASGAAFVMGKKRN